MTDIKSHTIRIPFCGFYESVAAYEVQESGENPVDYAKRYVKTFQDYFNTQTGLSIALTFEELDSPEFYDNDTDKVNCKVSTQDLECLHGAIDPEELRRTHIDSEFEPMDFTLPVSDWDLDQKELIFWCLLRQNDIDEIDYNNLLMKEAA